MLGWPIGASAKFVSKPDLMVKRVGDAHGDQRLLMRGLRSRVRARCSRACTTKGAGAKAHDGAQQPANVAAGRTQHRMQHIARGTRNQQRSIPLSCFRCPMTDSNVRLGMSERRSASVKNLRRSRRMSSMPGSSASTPRSPRSTTAYFGPAPMSFVRIVTCLSCSANGWPSWLSPVKLRAPTAKSCL